MIKNLQGWQEITLGELFEFKNGINSDKESYGRGVKFINVMEVIYNSSITADKIKGSVQLDSEQLSNYLVKRGDVLFNRTSETREEIALSAVYLDDEPVVFGGFVIRARPKRNLMDDNFKKYCFSSRSFREQAIEKGQGAIRTNIGQTNLEKIKLLIPPVPEQKKISQFLFTWDKAIDNLQKLIQAKESLKQGFIKRLLTGEIKIKSFEGKWKHFSLKQLASIVSGGTPDTKKKEYWGGNIDWVTPTDITALKGQRFIVHTERRITDAGLKNSSATLIPKNSVVVCTRATIGDCAINANPLTTNQGFKTLIPLNIDSQFLYYKIRSLKSELIGKANGSTFLEISKSDLENIEIFIPESTEEQTAIASVLGNLDDEIDILKKKLKRYQLQKSGLIEQLLSGDKKVSI